MLNPDHVKGRSGLGRCGGWGGEKGLLVSSLTMLGAEGDGEKSVNTRIRNIQTTCRNGGRRVQGKTGCMGKKCSSFMVGPGDQQEIVV